MPEKSRGLRKRRRFLVEFEAAGIKHTGFTHDISPSGLFVCSIRAPKPGTAVAMTLRSSKDKDLKLAGVAVRSFRGPATLAGVLPSGFGVRFSQAPPEEYFQLLATL
ncbi:MAG: PilZ domain-containing protein [Acidobacteriota bacterium]|nr:PilZ domain-containing protein [Acidobacteriota bacterium]